MFSLTFSPLHLIFPIGEITAEVRVVDKFSIAAVGGTVVGPGEAARIHPSAEPLAIALCLSRARAEPAER